MSKKIDLDAIKYDLQIFIDNNTIVGEAYYAKYNQWIYFRKNNILDEIGNNIKIGYDNSDGKWFDKTDVIFYVDYEKIDKKKVEIKERLDLLKLKKSKKG